MKELFYNMKSQWLLLGFALLFITGCAATQPNPASQDESPSQPPNEQTRSITTKEWVVRLAPGVDPYQLAMEYGAQNLGQIGTLQDTYLFKRPCTILYGDGLDPSQMMNVCYGWNNRLPASKANVQALRTIKIQTSVIKVLFL